MRFTKPLALCVTLITPFLAAAEEPEPANPDAGAAFWLAPKTDLDLRALSPVTVKVLAAPDGARGFALLKIGDVDPSENFVPTRPDLVPYIADEDTGYRVEPEGLKVGVRAFGDRKYKLRVLPEALAGLTLLQTKMGHKSVVDGRFSVVVSVARPCYVFVAVDERVLETYKAHGTPSWLQEYAPTGLKLATDEPVMDQGECLVPRVRQEGPGGTGPPSARLQWTRIRTRCTSHSSRRRNEAAQKTFFDRLCDR